MKRGPKSPKRFPWGPGPRKGPIVEQYGQPLLGFCYVASYARNGGGSQKLTDEGGGSLYPPNDDVLYERPLNPMIMMDQVTSTPSKRTASFIQNGRKGSNGICQ